MIELLVLLALLTLFWVVASLSVVGGIIFAVLALPILLVAGLIVLTIKLLPLLLLLFIGTWVYKAHKKSQLAKQVVVERPVIQLPR